jgi:hypothetical protein
MFCIVDFLVTVIDVAVMVMLAGSNGAGYAKGGRAFRGLRILRILRAVRMLQDMGDLGDTVRVVLSFPFFIIVGSLDLFKWLRSQEHQWTVLYINLFRYLIPLSFVLLMSDLPPSVVSIAVWVINVYFLFPVIAVVMNRVRRSHAKTSITPGTFCFRPSYRLRFTFSNVLAVGGIGTKSVGRSRTVLQSPPSATRTSIVFSCIL